MSRERRSPRVQRPFLVRYRPREAAHASWGMSPLKDLGAGGARFVAEAQFAVGQHLLCEINLPTARTPVSLEGTVAWVRAAPMGLTEYGVQFATSDAATHEALEEAVRRFTSPGGP